MYLKRLDILGFKSFADKTVLNFEPGIAVVVGPNGCGKSNIFDSIRWVLGEQSIKSLRGTKMEDVIFSGTVNKPALGFAEVSLTFSNEQKVLPIEYDEVTVSRRLFRSGESEYLINKLPVRLRDVNELFMGTGIGAESYSLVEQGKIDLMISSKPEDRRMIFDEAAGITKYKSKKREALNKLKDTENNLLRISDIITELKRQIGSIERQANKARKYKDEFEKLKKLEVKSALYQTKELDSKKVELTSRKDSMSERNNILDSQIQKVIDTIGQQNLRVKEMQDKINEVSSECLKKDSVIEHNTQHITVSKERIQESAVRKEKIREQEAILKDRIAGQKEKLKVLEEEFGTIASLKNQKSKTLTERNEQLSNYSNAIKATQDQITQLKMTVMELTTEQTSLKNTVTDTSARYQHLLARKKRLDIEKTKVCSEKETVGEDFEKVSSQWQAIQDQLTELSGLRSKVFNDCKSLKEEASHLQKEIVEYQNKKLSLESQKEFIEDLQLKYDDIPGGGHSVLITNPGMADEKAAVLGKIKQVSELDTKYRSLANQHFAQDDIVQLKQIMCETKFISLDLQQITNKIEEISDSINHSKSELNGIKDRIQSKEEEITAFDAGIRKQELQLANKQTQKDSINETLVKLREELELVDMELTETSEDIEKIKQKEDDLKCKQTEMEQRIEENEGEIIQQQSLISQNSSKREDANISIAQLQAELESLEERQNGEQDKYKILQSSWKQDLDNLASFEKELFDLEGKKEELEKNILRLEEEISQAQKNKKELLETLNEHRSEQKELDRVIEQHRSNLDKQQKELESARSDIHKVMMQVQEIEFQITSVRDRISQAYKVDLTQQQSDQEAESAEEFNHGELLSEIETLKKRVERYGSVNLVAIEEFEELKNRYEFLTKQQEDLIKSKEALTDTISKINRTSRKLFLETFQRVSEEFKKYFRMLFGGGDGQLILIDPHDPLESGIEIIAKPPGKKLQSISLLSGGEKALAAIALIFGVFKVKPSPFCVLDEIDAPLDESNVGRFSSLLKEFTKNSQFVVISHNKKTMVNADVMYGITMQETGVSKIVSVKFGESEQKQPEEELVAA